MMYSAALTAMLRHRDCWRCSYASKSALATNDVETRFGAPLGTTVVRVCQGKLYPQHQYAGSRDRRAISLSIIRPTRSSWLGVPSFESLRNAIRKSAMAFGFWVLGVSASRRMLTGLRFNTWVRTSRGSLEFRNGRAVKTLLFRAS